MLTTSQFKKSLLATSIVALFSFGATTGFAGQEGKEKRVYVDPATGQIKEAKKLLSEMTDEEKAMLSNDEYKALKELEDKLAEQAKSTGKQPGS